MIYEKSEERGLSSAWIVGGIAALILVGPAQIYFTHVGRRDAMLEIQHRQLEADAHEENLEAVAYVGKAHHTGSKRERAK